MNHKTHNETHCGSFTGVSHVEPSVCLCHAVTCVCPLQSKHFIRNECLYRYCTLLYNEMRCFS